MGRPVTALDETPVEETSWLGLPIAVEVRGGGVRYPGTSLEREVPPDLQGYGYFPGLEASDGDSLDAVLGPHFNPDWQGTVYLAVQNQKDTQEFLQFKPFIGFDTEDAAKDAFFALWPSEMFGGMQAVPADRFRREIDTLVDEDAGPASSIPDEARTDESEGAVATSRVVEPDDTQTDGAPGEALFSRGAELEFRAAKTRWRGHTIVLEAEGGSHRETGHEQAVPQGWGGTGYFKELVGRGDGDHLDVVLGPEVTDDSDVYMAVQLDGDEFRQFKILIGFASEAQAEAAYRLHWKPATLGGLWRVSAKEFEKRVLPRITKAAESQSGEALAKCDGIWPRIAGRRTAAREVQVNPHEVEPPHEVKNQDKYARLVEDMRAGGWQGRPILAYMSGGSMQALTGSHRIAAAREAGLAVVPVVLIEDSDFPDAAAFTRLDEAEDNYDRLRALEKALKVNPALQEAYDLMLREVAEKNKSKTRTSAVVVEAAPGLPAAIGLGLGMAMTPVQEPAAPPPGGMSQSHQQLEEAAQMSLPEYPYVVPTHKTPAENRAEQNAVKYSEAVYTAAAQNGLDPALLDAVIWTESRYDPAAMSGAGAQGLLQLNKVTQKELGVKNPFSAAEAIPAGARYLAKLLSKFNGNVDLAIAAYNAGPRNVIRYRGVPPFPETEAYVEKVKARMQTSPFHRTGAAGMTTFERLPIGAKFLRTSGAKKDVCTKVAPDAFETPDGRRFVVDNAQAPVVKLARTAAEVEAFPAVVKAVNRAVEQALRWWAKTDAEARVRAIRDIPSQLARAERTLTYVPQVLKDLAPYDGTYFDGADYGAASREHRIYVDREGSTFKVYSRGDDEGQAGLPFDQAVAEVTRWLGKNIDTAKKTAPARQRSLVDMQSFVEDIGEPAKPPVIINEGQPDETASFEIPIDISGSRYERTYEGPLFDPRTIDPKKVGMPIVLHVTKTPREGQGGSWDPYTKVLEVNVPSIPTSDREMQRTLAQLGKTVQHEVVHAVQTILGKARGLKTEQQVSPYGEWKTTLRDAPAGLPPGAEPYDFYTDQAKPHTERDIEFYSNLVNEVEEFKRQHKTWGYNDQALRDAARAYIEGSERFRQVKALDENRWRKMVTEFMRQVAGLGRPAEPPEGGRILERQENRRENREYQKRMDAAIPDSFTEKLLQLAYKQNRRELASDYPDFQAWVRGQTDEQLAMVVENDAVVYDQLLSRLPRDLNGDDVDWTRFIARYRQHAGLTFDPLPDPNANESWEEYQRRKQHGLPRNTMGMIITADDVNNVGLGTTQPKYTEITEPDSTAGATYDSSVGVEGEGPELFGERAGWQVVAINRRRRAQTGLRPNLFWEDASPHDAADGEAAPEVIEFREATPAEFEAGISQVDQSALDSERDPGNVKRLFMSTDGNAGYALGGPDAGEIKWVWSLKRGYGRQAMEDAMRNGGHYLDCMDNGKLVGFYSTLGFQEWKREPNWTPGGPDVVWMDLPGKPAPEHVVTPGTNAPDRDTMGYDEGSPAADDGPAAPVGPAGPAGPDDTADPGYPRAAGHRPQPAAQGRRAYNAPEAEPVLRRGRLGRLVLAAEDLDEGGDEDECPVTEAEDEAVGKGTLKLNRSGYQRYRGTYDGKKVWIGCEAVVEHGSYGGNQRQRRKPKWIVKVNGKEVGEGGTLREAKAIAEAELGIVREGQDEAAQHAVMPSADDLLALVVTAADLEVEAAGRRKKEPWSDPWPAGARPPYPKRPPLPRRKKTEPVEELGPAREPAGPGLPEDWAPPALSRVEPPEDQPFAREDLPPPVEEQPFAFQEEEEEALRGEDWPEDYHPSTHRPPPFERPEPLSEAERQRRMEMPLDPLPPSPPLTPDEERMIREEQAARDKALASIPKDVIKRTFKDLGVKVNEKPGDGYDNIMSLMRLATPEEVEFYKDWYDKAHRDVATLAKRYGKPVPLVAALVAVTSPNLKWEKNLEQAERILRGEERTSAYPENTAKAKYILQYGDLSVLSQGEWGPKVGPFFESIASPPSNRRRTVIDGHAANIWRGDTARLRSSSVSDAERAAMQNDYQRVADALHMDPQSVQAITWSVWREVVERLKRQQRKQKAGGLVVFASALAGLGTRRVAALVHDHGWTVIQDGLAGRPPPGVIVVGRGDLSDNAGARGPVLDRARPGDARLRAGHDAGRRDGAAPGRGGGVDGDAGDGDNARTAAPRSWFKAVRVSDLKRVLKRLGYKHIRTWGDHEFWSDGVHTTQVDMGRDPVDPNAIVGDIIPQMGITGEELLSLLGQPVPKRRRDEGGSDEPAGANPILTLSGEEFIMSPPAGYEHASWLPSGDIVGKGPGGVVLTDAFFDLPPEGRARALSRIDVDAMPKDIVDYGAEDEAAVPNVQITAFIRQADYMVAPDGTVHEMGGLSHPDWALQNYRQHTQFQPTKTIDYEPLTEENADEGVFDDNEQTALDAFMNEGWIRVKEGNGIELSGIDAGNIGIVKRILRQMAKENPGRPLYVDAGNGSRTIQSDMRGRILDAEFRKLGAVPEYLKPYDEEWQQGRSRDDALREIRDFIRFQPEHGLTPRFKRMLERLDPAYREDDEPMPEEDPRSKAWREELLRKMRGTVLITAADLPPYLQEADEEWRLGITPDMARREIRDLGKFQQRNSPDVLWMNDRLDYIEQQEEDRRREHRMDQDLLGLLTPEEIERQRIRKDIERQRQREESYIQYLEDEKRQRQTLSRGAPPRSKRRRASIITQADLDVEAAQPVRPQYHDKPYPEPKRDPTTLAPPGSRKKKDDDRLHLKKDGGYANIMKVLGMATPSEVEYWGKWYPFASSIVREMAGRYGLPVEVVAGVVAVLSPGSKWHSNIAVAKQVIEHWQAQREYGPFSTPALSGVGGPRLPEETVEDVPPADEDYDEDEGEEEVAASKAAAPNPYDTAFVPLKTQPEGAESTVFRAPKPKTHPFGLHGPHPAGYPDNLKKAVRILNGADPEEVVTGPKVKIFYQSLLDPDFVKDRLVLDGHAINIWRGEKRPLKGLKTPAEGSPERARMEADYKRAAEASGLSVQAVQAITWFVWKSVKNPKTAASSPPYKPTTPQTGQKWRAVEPVTLNREDGSGKDTIGDGEQVVFAGSDGVFYTVRTQTGRYTLPPAEFMRKFAPAEAAKPRPDMVRGVPMGGRPQPVPRPGPTPAPVKRPEPLPVPKPQAPAEGGGLFRNLFRRSSSVTAAAMRFPPKAVALDIILEDSGIGDEGRKDYQDADAAYKRWQRQYAANRAYPKPVYEGGELDSVNEALGLYGARRVSGLLEAFEKLTVGVRTWNDPRLEWALDILAMVPGLENIRLPEFVLEHQLDKDEKAYREEYSVPETPAPGEDDIPFDVPSVPMGEEREPGVEGSVHVSALDFEDDVRTAARRPRKKKRRRFPGETYYASKAGDNIARATMAGMGPAPVEEVRLEPGATVLREGDEHMIRLEERGASLDEIMREAMELGYDAVRVKDRAAILNQDVVTRTPVKRPGWAG